MRIKIKQFILTAFCVIFSVLAVNFSASATPVAPDRENGEGIGGCFSHASDTVVTLDRLREKQKRQSNGQIACTPRNTSAAVSRAGQTETSLPLVMIVIGFQGESTFYPDGIPYDPDFDWNDRIFNGNESLAQYYRDMSLGKFTFTPAVETSAYGKDGNTNLPDTANDGVVHVTINRSHGAWHDMRSETAWEEMYHVWYDAIMEASKYINFSAYDTDHDGHIRTDELALGFIVAGYEAADSPEGAAETEENPYGLTFPMGEDNYLWSHAWDINNLVTSLGADSSSHPLPSPKGTVVNWFIAIPEYSGETEYGESPVQGRIGVLAHELGHYLGLRDLYNINNAEKDEWSDYSVRHLSLMDAGGWGTKKDGTATMYSIDPYCRTMLGWIKPVNADSAGIYTAKAQDYENDSIRVVRIDTGIDDEYYLVENRSCTGWDEGLNRRYKDTDSSTTGGLVFWHVDNGIINRHGLTNTINSTGHRPGLMVMYPEKEADGTNTLIRKGSGGKVIDNPFFSEAELKNRPELLSGFRLPMYGLAEKADRLMGRRESCIGFGFGSGSESETTFCLTVNHTKESKTYQENYVAPTEKKEGKYDTVCYCKNCHAEISRTTTKLAKLLSGWKQVGSKWYYYRYGERKVGWQRIDGQWYYFGAQGSLQTGWKRIDGDWYYLTRNGRKTGWLKLSGKYHYLNANGIRQTGWKKIKNKWYYLTAKGGRQTGWKKIRNKKYYFGAQGVLQTGWKRIKNKWYYFGAQGTLQTGWKKIKGKWYYLGKNGVRVTGKKKLGSKVYRFNKKGVCLNK